MAKIVNWIKEFYPQYMGIKRYPANQCACVKCATDEWGILGNFGRAAVVVNGVEFSNTEKLFQCMKFTYAPVVRAYETPGLKIGALVSGICVLGFCITIGLKRKLESNEC